MRLALLALAGALVVTGCSDLKNATPEDASPPADAGADRGSHDARRGDDVSMATDAGHDGRSDAARDSGRDAPPVNHPDAGRDAPPDVKTRRDAPPADAAPADAPPDAPVVCTAATCPVVTMAEKLYDPVAVAVDDTYLYWLEWGGIGSNDYGELVQILKDAPCLHPSCYGVLDPMVLANDVTYGTEMGLGPGGVCYTQTFDEPAQHSVSCIPFSTGSEVSLEQGDGTAGDIWVGDAGAIWAIAGSSSTSMDGAIHSATFAGATSTLASGRAQPWAVASANGSLYWTELGATANAGAVYQSAPDGGAIPLATGQGDPVGLAIYAGSLYWTDSYTGTVWQVGVDSSPPLAAQMVASGLTGPFAVAVDATGIYVANVGSAPDYINGSVVQFAAAGASGTVMLESESSLNGIAIDGTFLYAAVAGNGNTTGEILRIAKTKN